MGLGGVKMTYKVIFKKTGQLLLKFVAYDKKTCDSMLKSFKKYYKQFDVIKVVENEKI